MLDVEYAIGLRVFRLENLRHPAILDLYCGAGGATEGYQRAGFYTVGVDYNWKIRYCGDAFIKANACRWLRQNMNLVKTHFDAIHASPPCDVFCAYTHLNDKVGSAEINEIPHIRELLIQTGLPYVIENVENSPLLKPTTLCGSSFGLDVRRHRKFETNWNLPKLDCDHSSQKAKGKRYPGASLRNGRYTAEIGVSRIPMAEQKRAMGINRKMTRAELSDAIPPAYTEYIGKCLMLNT